MKYDLSELKSVTLKKTYFPENNRCRLVVTYCLLVKNLRLRTKWNTYDVVFVQIR